MLLYNSEERFAIIFESGEFELFEFNQGLFWIQTEKTREHDCCITGFDYCINLKLIVTCDSSGAVRVWNSDKKFIREILFPTSIDSVCFLDNSGDLLISHAERISHIKFSTYYPID